MEFSICEFHEQLFASPPKENRLANVSQQPQVQSSSLSLTRKLEFVSAVKT